MSLLSLLSLLSLTPRKRKPQEETASENRKRKAESRNQKNFLLSYKKIASKRKNKNIKKKCYLPTYKRV